MKRILWLVIAMLLVAAPVFSAEKFEQISVTSVSAVGFTASKIVYVGPVGQVNATSAYCTLETASVRIAFDGTTPTSTVGHLIASSGWFQLTGYNQISNFKAIAPSTTGVLSCTYSFE